MQDTTTSSPARPERTRKPKAPKPPPERHARCEPAPAGANADYMLVITRDRETFIYWLTRLRTDYGVGFRFEQGATAQLKHGQEPYYDVLHDAGEPSNDSCSCPGWLRWGHCKHHAALAELLGRGELSPRQGQTGNCPASAPADMPEDPEGATYAGDEGETPPERMPLAPPPWPLPEPPDDPALAEYRPADRDWGIPF